MLANKGKVLFTSCNKHVLISRQKPLRDLMENAGKVTCDQIDIKRAAQSVRMAEASICASVKTPRPISFRQICRILDLSSLSALVFKLEVWGRHCQCRKAGAFVRVKRTGGGNDLFINRPSSKAESSEFSTLRKSEGGGSDLFEGNIRFKCCIH